MITRRTNELSPHLEQLRAAQLGLWTRRQALDDRWSKAEIDARLRSRRWIGVLTGVLALPGTPVDHDRLLLAACLARPSTLASHESAAWLWGLLDRPPPAPTVSVSRSAGHRRLGPVKVRRVTDLPSARVVWHRHTPCTNPLRTLADLAGVVDPATLNDAVDRALARGLLTVPGLRAELLRLRRPGRRGVGSLERSLKERGMIGVPRPSVLESKLMRLMGRAGIEPTGVEVTFVGDGGDYRLDTMLAPGVAVEVDGFAFHHRPEDRARDLHRHNDLTRHDLWVIRFTWQDVVHRPAFVVAEMGKTLAARRTG